MLLSDTTETVTKSGRLAKGRWGHIAASGTRGTAVIAGGMGISQGFQTVGTTEYYVPAIDPRVCLADLPDPMAADR